VTPPRDTNHGIFPGGYYLFDAARPAAVSAAAQTEKTEPSIHKAAPVSWKDKSDQLWKGWLLPSSDGDVWFVAGSGEYYYVLQAPNVNEAINALKIRYRGLKLS